MYFGDVYMPLYVEKKPPRVEVYSLATNSWRTIRNNAGYYANDTFSSVFLNEAVHWFASKTGEESSANVVLLFDFNSEKFGEIMLPMYHEEVWRKPSNFCGRVKRITCPDCLQHQQS